MILHKPLDSFVRKHSVLPPPLSSVPQVSLCCVQGTRLLAWQGDGAALLPRPKRNTLITFLLCSFKGIKYNKKIGSKLLPCVPDSLH